MVVNKRKKIDVLEDMVGALREIAIQLKIANQNRQADERLQRICNHQDQYGRSTKVRVADGREICTICALRTA